MYIYSLLCSSLSLHSYANEDFFFPLDKSPTKIGRPGAFKKKKLAQSESLLIVPKRHTHLRILLIAAMIRLPQRQTYTFRKPARFLSRGFLQD